MSKNKQTISSSNLREVFFLALFYLFFPLINHRSNYFVVYFVSLCVFFLFRSFYFVFYCVCHCCFAIVTFVLALCYAKAAKKFFGTICS